MIAVVNTANGHLACERPQEYLDFFWQLGATTPSINFEETEGVNVPAESIPSMELARLVLEQLARAREQLQLDLPISELDRPLSQLKLIALEPEIQPETAELLPTIAWDGSIVMLSPELAGCTSRKYGDHVVGNIRNMGLGTAIRHFEDSLMWRDYLTGRPAEHSEIDQLNFGPVLDQHCAHATRTRRSGPTRLDHDPNRHPRRVDHAEHIHIRQTYQQLTNTRRVNFHRGSPESEGVRHLQIRRAPVPR